MWKIANGWQFPMIHTNTQIREMCAFQWCFFSVRKCALHHATCSNMTMSRSGQRFPCVIHIANGVRHTHTHVCERTHTVNIRDECWLWRWKKISRKSVIEIWDGDKKAISAVDRWSCRCVTNGAAPTTIISGPRWSNCQNHMFQFARMSVQYTSSYAKLNRSYPIQTQNVNFSVSCLCESI